MTPGVSSDEIENVISEIIALLCESSGNISNLIML